MLIDLESPDLSGDASPAVSPKAGPDAPAGTTLDYTSAVCIIGGGIAGLVLARALAAKGTEVLVLEAGGLELEDRSQILFQAEMERAIHTGSLEGRFRTFGGSSTRWGGQMLPFSDDILSPAAGKVSQGWPVEQSRIAPYFGEVQQIMHVGTLPFTDALLPELGHAPVAFAPEICLRYSKWAPFSKRNLANTVGRECLENPKIRIFTHANVVEL